MTTSKADIYQLAELADELTLVCPPPKRPLGDNTILHNGRWVVKRAGAGLYVLRAEYDTPEGEVTTVKLEHEMSGFAQALAVSIKFAIQMTSSSRLHWLPV